jgi:hypothetical protein
MPTRRFALLIACAVASMATASAWAAERAAPPSWGAIASVQGWWGYSFNHASRGAAEQAARTQCERAAGRRGTCLVRISFDRACGALATGNFGEWGAASAATAAGAGQAAAAQCNGHLPTEPCKVVLGICSPSQFRAP